MNFLKKLSNYIDKKDNNSTASDKKNNTKSINNDKIKGGVLDSIKKKLGKNDKKNNLKISIETMKIEFDTLASQINNFLTLFNESKNNANAKLLEIIENLYAIHNNLIKKIKEFKIETGLQTKKIEDMKGKYEYTIFCNDSQLIKLNNRDIESACGTNETLEKILSNFEELKDIIAKLNVQQLKSINIKFESFFDKDKNKEIENMREKILASLENLCEITYEKLIEFFVNIFLKKKKIKIENEKQKEEENRKILEEQRRKKQEEEMKKAEEYERKEKEEQKMKEEKELSGLIDKFLGKYPSDFDYKDATDDFYSIFKGIMKLCGGHTENILSNDFLEWNVEFDDNAKLSEKSADKLKKLCEHMSRVYYDKKKINFLYENLKKNIKKFFYKEGANFEILKKYFKNCHLNPKTEEQKLQQEEKNKALQEVKKLLLKNGIPKENIQKFQNECKNIKTEFESDGEISKILEKYYYIYLNLYNFLSRVDSKVVGEELNVDLNNDELNYKLECLNKLKEWFRMILDKINNKDKSLKDIKKLFKGSFFKKSSLKILFEDLSNKNFSIEKIKASKLKIKKEDIDKLKQNFLTNAKEKIFTLTGRYQVFTAQNIINFFNEYYKFYSDLYDIYECLPTTKWFNKELDAKIEYTNIDADDIDITSENCDESLIKRTINDISSNIPKFQEIQQWFDKICNKKDNNYRGAPQDIFNNNNFISMCLLTLKRIKLPTNEDVEKIKKQQFSSIENWD